MGNPLAFLYMRTSDSYSAPYFFPATPTTGKVASWLDNMSNTHESGVQGVAWYDDLPVYLSFNNDTSNYTTAGNYAGYWTARMSSANIYTYGSTVDFEGQWSSEAQAWTEVTGYRAYEPNLEWIDAGWRSGDWTYSQMMSYINGIDSAFYGQTEGFIQPQNYYANMNQCVDYPIDVSSCPENPWIGASVTGITSQEGTPYSIQTQFNNYASQPYPQNSNTGLDNLVSAYADNITFATWSTL